MTYSDIPTMLFIFGLIAFAYYGKDKWLFIISGFSLLALGFLLWDWVSITGVTAGVYLVIKAFTDKRLNQKGDE
jgi:uncharacterized membrane protein